MDVFFACTCDITFVGVCAVWRLYGRYYVVLWDSNFANIGGNMRSDNVAGTVSTRWCVTTDCHAIFARDMWLEGSGEVNDGTNY